MTNYYEILGCSKDATFEELKKSYQENAKKLHPDKNDSNCDQNFLLLDKAWKTLRDPDKRKEYDETLSRNELEDMPLYCEVLLTEMDFKPELNIYSYMCRCGGEYQLNVRDLKDGENIRICCDECTFHILVRKS